jgi:hypothetical protein
MLPERKRAGEESYEKPNKINCSCVDWHLFSWSDSIWLRTGTNRDMQNQSPQNQSAHAARPGAISYVEGDAAIDNQPLNPDAVGSVELQKGQVLTTQAGKVEILLTPGVFLRVADNSTVKMVSPDLANTEVELDKGRAMVEVTDISKTTIIRADQNGASMQLLKKGLYDCDADHNQVRVFKGKVDVFLNSQKIGLGDNRGLTLTGGGKLKAQSFDERQYTDDFCRWPALRSGYLAEAGTDT